MRMLAVVLLLLAVVGVDMALEDGLALRQIGVLNVCIVAALIVGFVACAPARRES